MCEYECVSFNVLIIICLIFRGFEKYISSFHANLKKKKLYYILVLHALFKFLYVNNPQLLIFLKELMRKNAFPMVGQGLKLF